MDLADDMVQVACLRASSSVVASRRSASFRGLLLRSSGWTYSLGFSTSRIRFISRVTLAATACLSINALSLVVPLVGSAVTSGTPRAVRCSSLIVWSRNRATSLCSDDRPIILRVSHPTRTAATVTSRGRPCFVSGLMRFFSAAISRSNQAGRSLARTMLRTNGRVSSRRSRRSHIRVVSSGTSTPSGSATRLPNWSSYPRPVTGSGHASCGQRPRSPGRPSAGTAGGPAGAAWSSGPPAA